MIKFSDRKMIEVSDWDDLVTNTYGRPYCFQQQDGCQDRGIYDLLVSAEGEWVDSGNDTIPEEINGDEMGVKFSSWLARDPKEWNGNKGDENFLDIFWERNFYPDIEILAHDLCKKGLIEPGEYAINIDW